MSGRKPTLGTTSTDVTSEPRPTTNAPTQQQQQQQQQQTRAVATPEEKKQHLKQKRVDYASQLQFNNPDKYAELQQRRSDRAADKSAKTAAKLERRAKGETVEQQQSKEQLEKEKEQEEAADDEFLGIKTGSEAEQQQQQV